MNNKPFAMAAALFLSLSVLLSACGGGGNSGGGASAGSPVDSAKAFYTSLLAGDAKVSDSVCSTLKSSFDAASITAAYKQLTANGGKLDASGLKFDAGTQSGDTASVKVSGSLKVTVSGQSVDQPFPGATLQMKNESGAWKFCGMGQ